jgi:hypothetical protein
MTPSKKIICGLFTLTLGICPNASLAQNPTPQQPSSPAPVVKGPSPQSPTKFILKEGTEVSLKLAQRLTSKGAVVGEPVELALADDLTVGDAIVVKKGARVLGTVLEGKESEKKSAEAYQLKIRVDFLKAGDVKIKLRGEEAAAGNRNKKAMAAGAVALGVSGLLLASQGMLRANFTRDHSPMQDADFAKAARFARMAAEKAPENVEYREALAT